MSKRDDVQASTGAGTEILQYRHGAGDQLLQEDRLIAAQLCVEGQHRAVGEEKDQQRVLQASQSTGPSAHFHSRYRIYLHAECCHRQGKQQASLVA